MMKRSPYSTWPHFDTDEIRAVSRVLASGLVNQWTGDQCTLFAKEYAASLHVPYCIPLANGTVALELAWKVLGIGPGDEVIVPARSFVASASSVSWVGATPVFADVEKQSQGIDPKDAEKRITKRTKAILAVHLAGWPAAVKQLRTLCDKHALFLVEDCAQAHGAAIDGKPVGSWGDVAAFSFCQDKIITTAGEGGLLALKKKEHFLLAWSLKDHGKEYSLTQKKEDTGFRWLHTRIGTNWRMTELQAAIGRIQLKKLAAWTQRRQENAHILIDALVTLPCLSIPLPPKNIQHAWYRLYTFVRPAYLKKGWDRERIRKEIQKEGVPVFTGSCPEIYKEKAFSPLWQKSHVPSLSCAQELGETSLAFLVHPTLTKKNMETMATVIKTVLSTAQQ